MGDLFQFVHRQPPHGLGGGIAHLNAQLLFQLSQLVKEPVIRLVAHGGSIETVIFIPVLVQLRGQCPQPVNACLCHFISSLLMRRQNNGRRQIVGCGEGTQFSCAPSNSNFSGFTRDLRCCHRADKQRPCCGARQTSARSLPGGFRHPSP